MRLSSSGTTGVLRGLEKEGFDASDDMMDKNEVREMRGVDIELYLHRQDREYKYIGGCPLD